MTAYKTRKAASEKRDAVSRLCGLAWANVCQIADHQYRPVPRAAVALEACVAVVQASKLRRGLTGKAAERPAFELSRCTLALVDCIESRLYPQEAELGTELAEAFGTEWLLIEAVRVAIQAEVFNREELRQLACRVHALQERAADRLITVQGSGPEACSYSKFDGTTAEYRVTCILAGLEDLDGCIEIEIEDA